MDFVQLHDKKFKRYISAEEIDSVISDLADQLNQDYEGKKPLLLPVLNGSFMFASDLMKKLKFECELSFVKFKSYSGTESTGNVNEVIGLEGSIEGRDVIIIEDIVDTGNTAEHILNSLRTKSPKEIKIVTLLFKPDVFDKSYTIDYVGKNIPNKFVVGYGLDYDEIGRNLKEIYQLV